MLIRLVKGNALCNPNQWLANTKWVWILSFEGLLLVQLSNKPGEEKTREFVCRDPQMSS